MSGGDVPLHHPDEYFESMFAGEPDPWGFDTSWYEFRKYAATIAALPAERYRRAFEPGCANGALTALLADRCDELVAIDVVGEVVHRARERMGHHAHVDVQQQRFPHWWPEGRGDLVVWSEIAYYLTGAGGAVAVEGLERWLEPGGHLVAVHYLGDTDYPRRGADIAPWIDGLSFLERVVSHDDEGFELGVWCRIDPVRKGECRPEEGG